MMLAAMIKEPTLALDQKEAEGIAKAIAGVAAHYDVSASAKSVAWAHLLAVAGMAYIPRGIVLMKAMKERHPKKSAAPATVHPIFPSVNTGGFTG